MMPRKYWLGALFLLLSLGTVAPAQKRGQKGPGPKPPEVLGNLRYGPAGTANMLDVYMPAHRPKPVPLIIWIHGGAWEAGSKDNSPAVQLVGRGYAVASINYRLSGQAAFPAQIHDCKLAVRWLRAHALKKNVDPHRFGVWGASAGGHLAALLGTSAGVPELEGGGLAEQSSRVQAVCDWCGPADLFQCVARPAPKTPIRAVTKLLGGPLGTNKEKATLASPLTHVTRDDPPFLIMHGDRDTIVPHEQSQLLARALQQAGVPVAFHTVRGAGHNLHSAATVRMVGNFFDRHLKP